MSFQFIAARFRVVCLAVALTAGSATAQGPNAPPLRLEDAFARALADAPGLRAAEQAGVAADAGIRQADRRINPSFGIDIENAGGGSMYRGIERAETTLSFNQTLELGGDRRARTDLARTGAKAARADGAIKRQDLLHEVEKAFIAAQVSAADLAVANDRLSVAKEIVATVGRRVQAARDPLMAESRSQALLADAEIAVTGAQPRRRGGAGPARELLGWPRRLHGRPVRLYHSCSAAEFAPLSHGQPRGRSRSSGRRARQRRHRRRTRQSAA